MTEKDLKKTPVLDSFGTDLTKLAKEGKLDPVIGRDKEIKRLGQILSRRKKNSAILVGYEGSGKTSLVHGLAQKIVIEACSPLLINKRIIELDISAIVAGTKYRGQFEERFKSIMKEIEDNPNIVLFIDEVHTIIGAGSASGSGDASNMIKPALSNRKMQLIGVTTLDEYQKTIEKDRALNRRFQKIVLNPPSYEDTILILNQIKHQYENHHSVHYSNEIIENIVKLAERYLSNQQFPDKAIDIMDEVGAFVRGNSLTLQLPEEIIDLENKLVQLQLEKVAIVKQQKYEEAAIYRDKERIMVEELREIKESWLKKVKEELIIITEEDVATIVSAMSGVPVNKLTSEENVNLLLLEDLINSNVIGQKKAVYATVKELQKGRLGIKDPTKSQVFLYVGPTGVGKSQLAKAIAKYHFNDSGALIRVNMNEYSEKHSASRLTGSPPGFVGYEEGGELTNKVKNKPYAVVLLDEFEKAHPDVINVFLQVWDEGFLTDSQGFKVDFRNIIFILTSNVGTKQIIQFGKGIGYNKSSTIETVESENIILKELEKQFLAEVLNRIDDIIIFNNLTKDDLYKIIEINLIDLKNRLAKHFQFTLTDSVKDLLIKDGYDEKYGARPLKRSISKLIENKLIDTMLKGVKPGSIVQADVVEGEIDFTITTI